MAEKPLYHDKTMFTKIYNYKNLPFNFLFDRF